MAWWTVEKDGKEIDMGDETLDTVHLALSKIKSSYKRNLKRRPTPEELSATLEAGIRVLEEDIFDDMEDRELDSVVVALRQRPKRPRPEPGDYFAVPLPSGGFGYGRIMKVKLRILIWVRLISKRSRELLTTEELRKGHVVFECETGTNSIISLDWPIVGHLPLSEEEKRAVKSEPEWAVNYTARDIEAIADWKLSGKKGLPPGMDAPTC